MLPLLSWFLLAVACGREEWRNADLQLDIDAPVPTGTGEVRVCVQGQGIRTVGAAGDLYAVPGLVAGGDVSVTVDALSLSGEGAGVVLGRCGPVDLGPGTPWRREPWMTWGDSTQDTSDTGALVPAPEPCTASGSFAPDEEDSWLLAVRFLG